MNNGLIIPRRQLLVGASASLIVAPSIVRASSLMDINRLGNRLIVAFRPKKRNPAVEPVWFKSDLNCLDYISPDIYRRWTERCFYNEYDLMRAETVKEWNTNIVKKRVELWALPPNLRWSHE